LTARPADQIPVKINVKTNIIQGEDTETYEFITFGRYQQTDTASFLRYEEEMEIGKVSTTIKLSSDGALILRSGAMNMRMTFRQQQTMPGTYQTPYGTMQTEAHTQQLSFFSQPEITEGLVELIYDLTIQGSLAGTYHLNITYKEEGQ
jgi:uncharacterized beta-barrel protein YwiB (DUF1934 family)